MNHLPQIPDDATCGTCRWFEVSGNPKSGYCLRYPPTVLVLACKTGEVSSYVPEVSVSDYCGEWATLLNSSQTTPPAVPDTAC